MPIEATYYLCEYCDSVFENRAKCVRHEQVDHPERKVLHFVQSSRTEHTNRRMQAIMIDASTMVDKTFLREQLCPDLLLADAIKLETEDAQNSNGEELDTGEVSDL